MAEAYTGGCACGAAVVKLLMPMVMNDCQCRHCQQKSGIRDMVGDSGSVKTRGFCPTCGFAGLSDVRAHARTLHRARCDPR